jgi:hypothetical protein
VLIGWLGAFFYISVSSAASFGGIPVLLSSVLFSSPALSTLLWCAWLHIAPTTLLVRHAHVCLSPVDLEEDPLALICPPNVVPHVR